MVGEGGRRCRDRFGDSGAESGARTNGAGRLDRLRLGGRPLPGVRRRGATSVSVWGKRCRTAGSGHLTKAPTWASHRCATDVHRSVDHTLPPRPRMGSSGHGCRCSFRGHGSPRRSPHDPSGDRAAAAMVVPSGSWHQGRDHQLASTETADAAASMVRRATAPSASIRSRSLLSASIRWNARPQRSACCRAPISTS